MLIEFPPADEALLRSLAAEQGVPPEALVIRNLAVSMRDYVRQRTSPAPRQHSSLLSVPSRTTRARRSWDVT